MKSQGSSPRPDIKILKVFHWRFPLSRFLIKTLGKNKIAMKSFSKKKKKKICCSASALNCSLLDYGDFKTNFNVYNFNVCNFFQLVLISWIVTLSSCLIQQIISFILPPNKYGCVYARTTLENVVGECVRKLRTDFWKKRITVSSVWSLSVKKVKKTGILIDKPKP